MKSLAKVYSAETPKRAAAIADATVRTLVLPRLMEVDTIRKQEGLDKLQTALADADCTVALEELRALRLRGHHTLSYWVY